MTSHAFKIPIFKPGVHKDSEGNVNPWTDKDMKRMVHNFNSKVFSTVPIKVGHTSEAFNQKVADSLGLPVPLIKGEGKKQLGAIRIGEVTKLDYTDQTLNAVVQPANEKVEKLYSSGYFNSVSPEIRVNKDSNGNRDPALGALAMLGAQRPALAENADVLLEDGEDADEIYYFALDETSEKIRGRSTEDTIREREKFLKSKGRPIGKKGPYANYWKSKGKTRGTTRSPGTWKAGKVRIKATPLWAAEALLWGGLAAIPYSIYRGVRKRKKEKEALRKRRGLTSKHSFESRWPVPHKEADKGTSETTWRIPVKDDSNKTVRVIHQRAGTRLEAANLVAKESASGIGEFARVVGRGLGGIAVVLIGAKIAKGTLSKKKVVKSKGAGFRNIIGLGRRYQDQNHYIVYFSDDSQNEYISHVLAVDGETALSYAKSSQETPQNWSVGQVGLFEYFQEKTNGSGGAKPFSVTVKDTSDGSTSTIKVQADSPKDATEKVAAKVESKPSMEVEGAKPMGKSDNSDFDFEDFDDTDLEDDDGDETSDHDDGDEEFTEEEYADIGRQAMAMRNSSTARMQAGKSMKKKGAYDKMSDLLFQDSGDTDDEDEEEPKQLNFSESEVAIIQHFQSELDSKNDELAKLQDEKRIAAYSEQLSHLTSVPGTPIELATRLVEIESFGEEGTKTAKFLFNQWEGMQEAADASGLGTLSLVAGSGDSDAGGFMKEIEKFEEANPDSTNAQAYVAVSKQRPDLKRAYDKEAKTSVG